jgi:lysophospholipase L1-like esterase
MARRTTRSASNNDVANAVKAGRALADETLIRRKKAVAARTRALAAMRAPTAGVLIAEGDSWFDYPFYDIISKLEDKHGFDIESVAKKGDTVEDMAYAPGQLDVFARRIEKVLSRGQRPKAILLSGGGNDVAGEAFGFLLNYANAPNAGFNESVVAGVIDQRLKISYHTIISAVTQLCIKMTGAPLPIVIHGYDYPVPDGRGFWGGWWILPGPWLKPSFDRKLYADAARAPIIKALIDRFNTMLEGVARDHNHVRYLNLRRTLSIPGGDHKDLWGNEFHPTEKGFELIAAKFARVIQEP